MKTEISFSKILVLLIIVISFGGIIYLISTVFATRCPDPNTQHYDKDQKKCVKNCGEYEVYDLSTDSCKSICDSNQEIINGKCVYKCVASQIRCNNGDCYDPIDQYCDKNGTICNTVSHCPNSDTCCPNGQQCEESTNTCKVCDIDCNGTCCNKDQTCAINNTICCNPKNIGKDTKGIETCCKNDLCNGICCDESIGEVCINEKCQIGCPNLSKLNSGLYDKCNNQDIVFTGKPVECDYDTSLCLHDCTDINNPFKCKPKPSSCWDNTSYNPSLLLSEDDVTYDYTISSGQYKGQKTKVAVCQDTKNNLWISKGPSDLSRKVTLDPTTNNINGSILCDVDSCISKIVEPTSGIINYDKKTDTDSKRTNITNNICNSILSCDNSLLDNVEMTNLCSIFDRDKSTQGRCCKKSDNSGYTGQICPQNNICVNGNCINPSTYYTSIIKSAPMPYQMFNGQPILGDRQTYLYILPGKNINIYGLNCGPFPFIVFPNLYTMINIQETDICNSKPVLNNNCDPQSQLFTNSWKQKVGSISNGYLLGGAASLNTLPTMISFGVSKVECGGKEIQCKEVISQCYRILINKNGTGLETDYTEFSADWTRLNKDFNASFISLISDGSGNYVSCIYIEEK